MQRPGLPMFRKTSNARLAIGLLLAAMTFLTSCKPQDGGEAVPKTPKEVALESLRAGMAAAPYRGYKRPGGMDAKSAAAKLTADGLFSDMEDVESPSFQKDLLNNYATPQRKVAPRLELAFNRIWIIAEGLRSAPRPLSADQTELLARLYRAITHYGSLEAKRPNVSPRFHISCFAIPLAAVNTYFALLPEMEALEAEKPSAESEAAKARDILQALGYQAWTVPARGDATDADPVTVERFRKEAFWVGANALTYRPLLPVALMRRSQPMLDVLAEVADGTLSATSFATVDTSFSSEGMTVDGAAWAHGRQNQVFAYPHDALVSALEMLHDLKGTPWERPLTDDQMDCLFNYLRGSTWFSYKRVLPPVLDRQNMVHGSLGPADLPTKDIASLLLKDWKDQLDADQIKELEALPTLAGERSGTPPESVDAGNYHGVRYFWNQDVLAVKSPTHYMLVNMCSKRSDGLESAVGAASAWNFFTDDGHTLFCRDGREYIQAIGAWNLTALPGVTARQGEDRLTPINNWRGFGSSHNFAGGVSRGDTGCAGFVFEKENRWDKQGAGAYEGPDGANAIIYGIKAYKAFFVAGRTLLALGAGITDLMPELPGEVWTTINQTSWRGPVAGRDAQGTDLVAGPPDGNRVEWTLLDKGGTGSPSLSHDGFTYRVIPEFTTGTVRASLDRRSTKWDKLAEPNKRKKTPAEADIFQLWIDHGAHPQDAGYAYTVTADDDGTPSTASSEENLVVLSNDKKMQAVRSADGRLLMAVIYEAPATLPLDSQGHTLSVETPAVLMIEKSADAAEWIVTVNDPGQLAEKKAVRIITDVPLEGEGVSVLPDGKTQLEVRLPEAPLLGKPATLRVRSTEGTPNSQSSEVSR